MGIVDRVRCSLVAGVVFVALAVVLHRLLDPRLVFAGVGQLLLVFERPRELVACAGEVCGRGLLSVVDALREVGEVVDAVLELADQRQAGCRASCASV